MLRLGIFVLGIFPFYARVQTVALPHKSEWIIHHKGQEIQLGDRFLYIGVFDQLGYATYVKSNSMGIINVQGEILFNTPKKVTPLGFGNFLHNENELLKIKGKDIIHLDFSLSKNTSHWLIGHINYSIIAINKLENVKVDVGFNPVNVFDKYLKYSIGGINYLRDYSGKLIDSTAIDSKNDMETAASYCSMKTFGESQVMLWFTPRLKGIFHENFFFQTPKANEFIFLKNMVEIRDAAQTHLYDLKSQKIVMTAKGEFLRPIIGDVFKFKEKGKFGVINDAGQVLITPKYDDIHVFSQYTLVRQGQLVGLYDNNFRQILDCKYSSISPRYNFFYTSRNGRKGLVSRKTNKEILEPVYTQILIQDNKIKAWLNYRLLIFVFNEVHEIVQDFVVNNVISVDKTNFFDAKIDYDSRLFQNGWFFETRNVKDENGNNRFRLIWGLQNEHDSVIVRPQFFKLNYIHHAPFVLSPTEIAPKSLYLKQFRAISNHTGKTIKGLNIVDIDTSDFFTRQFARFVDPFGGYGIVKNDFSFVHFPYIDRGEEPFLRVCVSANVFPANVTKKIKDSINFEPILNPDLNSSIHYAPLKIGMDFFSHYQLKNTEWNFLKPDGTMLSSQNFYFAHRFVGNNAIVLTKTGYGVIDSSGYVIEPIYRKISREFYNGDTSFLVETFAQGSSLYEWQNGLLKPLPIQNVVVQKNRKSISILASAFQRHVVHDEMGIIKDSLNHVRLYKNGFFSIKKDKIFQLYDPEGNEIGQSTVKPKEFLNQQFFVVFEKAKMAIYSIAGNPVSDLKYNHFELAGDFILGKLGGLTDIFDATGNLIYPACDWVKHDPISGKLAFRFQDKIHFSSTKFTINLKTMLYTKPVAYFNNKLYLQKNQVFDEKGRVSRSDFGEFYDLQYFGNQYVAVESFKLPLSIFNIDGTQIQLPHEKIRKPKMLTNQIIEYRCESKNFLYNIENQKQLEIEEVLGEFNDGFLCVKLGANRFVYLNESLECSINMEYQNAKPFRGGRAAVQYFSGWTIIDTSGKCLYIPCLPEINMLSTDIVLAIPQSQLGLFDKKGKVIIPANKDAIHLAHDHIRTCRFGVVEQFKI